MNLPERLTKTVFVILIIYICIFLFLNHYLESGEKYPNLYKSLKGAIADKLFRRPAVDTDAYIVNTYYYPTSHSLGENALAMVLLMNRHTLREITNYRMTLVASNGSSSVTVVPKLQKEVYATCAYVNVVAITNLLPNLTKLELIDHEKALQILFKRPRAVAPKPVVICLAPQFVAEQWQLFLIHAHVAHRFGGHLHLYVTSMIDSYFELVSAYEKEGYVTVDHWVRPKFSSAMALDPNVHSEWRNQAGAHTDCLLQYKEAATFVTFFDLDDVLFPSGFDNYYDEFALLSFVHPNIKTFHYNKRKYVIEQQPNLADISFKKMFNHAQYGVSEGGKVMARPSNLNSMWIHHSFNTKDRERLYLNHNFISHVRIAKASNTSSPWLTDEFVEMESLRPNEQVLASIQNDFERMMTIQETRKDLPKDLFYFPIIFKCYFDKYYGKKSLDKLQMCPNGEGCELPQRDDLKCIHSDADYVHGPRMSPITFHYHQNARWSKEYGCYQ